MNASVPLPASGASLEAILGSSRAANVSVRYRERWGPEQYKARGADAATCNRRFRDGMAATGSSDELLLCLDHDITVAAYLNMPRSFSLI